MGGNSTFEKDPNAILDYTFDWGSWLADNETILTSIMTVGVGITKGSSSKNGTRTKVWLSGGAVGTTYGITNRITTSEGRVDDRTIYIKVAER